MAPPPCLIRREYDPHALLASHPPVLRHPHKQLVFVDRLVFYASDDAGLEAFEASAAPRRGELIARGAPGEPLAKLVDRIVGLEYVWGVSDGN